jgi:hypothetical protein
MALSFYQPSLQVGPGTSLSPQLGHARTSALTRFGAHNYTALARWFEF